MNIYTFDQWGVELGKQLANRILPELVGTNRLRSHGQLNQRLINRFKTGVSAEFTLTAFYKQSRSA